MLGNDYIPETDNQEILVTPIELAKLDTSIGRYTPELLISLLEDPTNVKYLYSDMVDSEGASSGNRGVLVSNKEEPAVLIEDKASFCSIILSFDSAGNAALLHSPLTPPGDIDTFEFSTFTDDNIVSYFREVRRNIHRTENATILTGHTDSTENNTNLVKKALEDFLGQSYPNLLRYTEFSDLDILNMRSAGGVIFIPKELTKIKRNVVLFADREINLKDIRAFNRQY